MWFGARRLESDNTKINVKKGLSPNGFFFPPQNTIYFLLHILRGILGHAMILQPYVTETGSLSNKQVPAYSVYYQKPLVWLVTIPAMRIKKTLQWIQVCHSQTSWLHEICRAGMDILKEFLSLVEQIGSKSGYRFNWAVPLTGILQH